MSPCAVFCSLSALRPEPGSRVKPISAHTQGAGVPFIGAPVKGSGSTAENSETSRIEYPPSVSNLNKTKHLRRRVTKL